jgi:hypothetical protein
MAISPLNMLCLSEWHPLQAISSTQGKVGRLLGMSSMQLLQQFCGFQSVFREAVGSHIAPQVRRKSKYLSTDKNF